jgi:hypothetical protein
LKKIKFFREGNQSKLSKLTKNDVAVAKKEQRKLCIQSAGGGKEATNPSQIFSDVL